MYWFNVSLMIKLQKPIFLLTSTMFVMKICPQCISYIKGQNKAIIHKTYVLKCSTVTTDTKII